MDNNSLPCVLVAIPAEWQDSVRQFLEQNCFCVQFARSPQHAMEQLQSQKFRALIVTSDWAISGVNTPSMIERVKSKLPTVTLIQNESIERYGMDGVFGRVFFPPFHEFCRIPFSENELVVELYRALRGQ